MEGKKWAAAIASLGRLQKRREGRILELEMKRVCVCVLPNEDFLPIFTLLYLTSYNEIMPSAPQIHFSTSLPYSYGKAPYSPLHDAYVPNKHGG